MNRLLILALAATLLACDKKTEEKKSGPPPTLITVAQVTHRNFEVTEDTLGTLEATLDPKIAAEVAGKIVQILVTAGQTVTQGQTLALIDSADLRLQNQAEAAEAKRLVALLAQQDKLVERQQSLVARGFLSQNAADDARAQRTAIAEQLGAAQARSSLGSRAVSKTAVVAPFDGIIENQLVAAGDYVKLGDPLFQLLSNRALQAHLPFPESTAPRIARGQTVRLTSPQAPGKAFVAAITDLRPAIVAGSRTVMAIVALGAAASELRAGGTVNASVRITVKQDALVVPEQSVVLRPAGKVVYAVVAQDGKQKVEQRIVQVGVKKEGVIEIVGGNGVEGIVAGETVALDGAGFLSHGATVAIKEPVKVGAGGTAQPSKK